MKMPGRLKLVAMGAGWLLLLALVMVVVGYMLAPHFYLTRVVFWGESDFKDLEKFPARTVHNGPSVSHFDRLPTDNPYASQIETIGKRSTNDDLVIVRLGKEVGEQGYDYWIDLFDELATKLDLSAIGSAVASCSIRAAGDRAACRRHRRWSEPLSECGG